MGVVSVLSVTSEFVNDRAKNEFSDKKILFTKGAILIIQQVSLASSLIFLYFTTGNKLYGKLEELR